MGKTLSINIFSNSFIGLSRDSLSRNFCAFVKRSTTSWQIDKCLSRYKGQNLNFSVVLVRCQTQITQFLPDQWRWKSFPFDLLLSATKKSNELCKLLFYTSKFSFTIYSFFTSIKFSSSSSLIFSMHFVIYFSITELFSMFLISAFHVEFPLHR